MFIRHLQSRTRLLIVLGLAVAVAAGAAIGGLYLTGGSLTQISTTSAASSADQQAARGDASDKASRGGRTESKSAAEKARQAEAAKRAAARVQAAERAAREAKREAAQKAAAQKAAQKKAAQKKAAQKAAQWRAAKKKAAEEEAARKKAAQRKNAYKVVDTVSGTASFFGDSGEYQPMACGGHTSEITEGVALWEIPCGTPIRITSKETGKSVIAPVTDRGPADWTGVAIDLLPDTWDALGVSRDQGLQEVTYEVLSK